MNRQKNYRENWIFELALIGFLALGLAFGAAADTASYGDDRLSQSGDQRLPGENGPEVAEIKSSESLVEKAQKGLHRLIDQATLKAKLRLHNGDESKIKWGVSVQRKTEPSYNRGDTSLIDDWNILIGKEHDFSKSSSVDLVGGVDLELKVTFARQFKGNSASDHAKLWLKDVRTPLDIPLSADDALNKLDPQEFMMIQVPLTVSLARSQVSSGLSRLPISLGAKLAMSGEFQIHLFRLDRKRFRIKLIGVRTKTKGAVVKFGYESDRGGWIGKHLSFSPLSFEPEWPESNLMLADYVVNLTDAKVKNAFNALVKEALTWKSLEIWNPMKSVKELRTMLLADASPLEELYLKEKAAADKDKAEKRKPKPETEWTVVRHFMGEDDAQSSIYPLKFGFRALARFEKGSTFTENKIIHTDKSGEVRYFLMPMFILNDKASFLMKLYHQELHRTANLLLETDSDFVVKPRIPGELSLYMEYRDNHFEPTEISRLKDYIRKRIPQQFYDEIDWRSWGDESYTRENARVTSLLVIKPEAMSLLEGFGRGDFIGRLGQYVDSLKEMKVYVETKASSPPGQYGVDLNLMNKQMMTPREYFQEDIVNEISPQLAALGNLNLSGADRQRAFLDLRRNQLWQEIGGGFLLQFLADETKRRNPRDEKGALKDLYSHMYYETTWSASDATKSQDSVDKHFGSCGNRRLYRSVMYIYNVLHNRNLDMRLLDNGDAEVPKDDNSCGDVRTESNK